MNDIMKLLYIQILKQERRIEKCEVGPDTAMIITSYEPDCFRNELSPGSYKIHTRFWVGQECKVESILCDDEEDIEVLRTFYSPYPNILWYFGAGEKK